MVQNILTYLNYDTHFQPLLPDIERELPELENFTGALYNIVSLLAQKTDKPLVLLFDEVDCLVQSTLITFLRQLRNGYINRSSHPSAHSVALIGMRNVRDFRASVRPDQESWGSYSPFNIVTSVFSLQSFDRREIQNLYTQHEEQTGQSFSAEATDAIFEATQGQPWLVNAIAREIVVKMLQRDFSQEI